ncbi:hypothetical protein C8R48DRAFT_670947 [Suillus tomentosus]|nr:hypothetical protein C8R48DRAFT_670947 [Suillus tomentosus]
MALKITSHKNSTLKVRFNLYSRPSPCTLRGAINAYEMQELKWGIKVSIKSYEHELQQHEDDKDTWMEFTMDLDLPYSTGSGTYGCADTTMVDDKIGPLVIVLTTDDCGEAWWYQYQLLKKRKLVCRLHACVNKYINCHCETLQTALLDVDVDDIILPEASSDKTQARKCSGDCLISLMVTRQVLNGINYIIPHRVKCGFLSLRRAATAQSGMVYKTVNQPASM